ALRELVIAGLKWKRRNGQHDADGEAGVGAERGTVAPNHAREDDVPPFLVQSIENGIAGIAESRGELQRPDAVIVDDGIDVDIAAIARVPEQGRDLGEGRREDRTGTAIGDESSHLSR